MQQWSRRKALALIAGASVVSYKNNALAGESAQSLGAIAARNGIVFGAAAGPVIDKDRAYRELYQTQTRIVTTDIAMKMGTIAPQPGPKRFESADRLLQFCASNNIPMRGHCLIWNDREVPLRAGITLIGRAEDTDLRIPLPSVSRHHARIVVKGLEATLEDLGSRHGSWRGATSLRGVITLAHGDEIRLGNAVIEYRFVTPRDTTIE